mmetsp:Transcript_25670/g.38419  ORF Transcript_25670/g.38419 Transcript_25670/m.38419 type:complete len:227 (+) Transcript_25670:742-1422(+)
MESRLTTSRRTRRSKKMKEVKKQQLQNQSWNRNQNQNVLLRTKMTKTIITILLTVQIQIQIQIHVLKRNRWKNPITRILIATITFTTMKKFNKFNRFKEATITTITTTPQPILTLILTLKKMKNPSINSSPPSTSNPKLMKSQHSSLQKLIPVLTPIPIPIQRQRPFQFQIQIHPTKYYPNTLNPSYHSLSPMNNSGNDFIIAVTLCGFYRSGKRKRIVFENNGKN